MYNFDIEVSRKGTNSAKWEYVKRDGKFIFGDHADPRHSRERLLPLWVADMDFPCPQPVIDALEARARHGIFGYTVAGDRYFDAVLNWTERHYSWSIEREWITLTPGIIAALNMLISTYTEPGDKVLIQRPVYHPFMAAIENKGREIVSNSLIYANGRYQMDFEDLKVKAADPEVKLAILCNPHNPVGRVWTQAELIRFGEICLEHDLLIISDDIHCDLLYSGVEFTPIASLDERFLQHSITCMAPSKTFNLAGLKNSNIIIANPDLRAPFRKTMEMNGVHGANCFALVATETAYLQGEEWLTTVMAYVEANFNFMQSYLAKHVPQIRLVQPEGTYLVWADCSALELSPEERQTMLMEEAHLFLNEGGMFGPEGEMFERFNIACPRPILAEALERIRDVVAARLGVSG